MSFCRVRAIFPFFHNGWCKFSISVNTERTGDPDFGDSVIGNFTVWWLFPELEPFFHFFTMADANFLFLSTQRGLETQSMGDSVIENFAIRPVFTELEPFFHFFIMADANFPFPLMQRGAETQTMGGSVIENFAVWRVFAELEPFFHFFTMANTNFPFPLMQRGPETQTMGGSVIENFAVQWFFTELEPFFHFFIMADPNFLLMKLTGMAWKVKTAFDMYHKHVPEYKLLEYKDSTKCWKPLGIISTHCYQSFFSGYYFYPLWPTILFGILFSHLTASIWIWSETFKTVCWHFW